MNAKFHWHYLSIWSIGCTAIEDGKRLETSDLESRGIILSI